MRKRKWLLWFVALVSVTTLFFPWVIIESRNLILSGMRTAGTAYGKPGLLSLVFAGIVLLFSFVPRTWALRVCLFCAAINTGWALRNFLMLSVCQGGECPQRQPAFYLYLLSSIFLLIVVLIQDIKIPETTETNA